MHLSSIASDPLRLAVLISGGGSTLVNLQQLILAGELNADVVNVIASRQCAGIDRCQEFGLKVTIINPRKFESITAFSVEVFENIRHSKANLVVLAGFLSRILIPEDFNQRVLNIHPSLIPAFCGAGMYGHHVHEAVLARGCRVTGCTVHFCDNEYDHGPIVLQRCVPVLPGDDPDRLAARVSAAEREIYPEAIRLFAAGRLRIDGRSVLIEEDASPSS